MGLTAFIFARGGSKGLPGKNTKELAGKPLIGWAIEQAFAVDEIARVIVSTDDESIAKVAKSFGAHVPFLRPAELSADNSPEWAAWQHALTFTVEKDDSFTGPFISVPATSPLRQPQDISRALELFQEGGADAVIAVTPAHRNPWFNMIQIQDNNFIKLVNDSASAVFRRQDAQKVYDMTTFIYIADPEFILRESSIFSGRVKAIEVPVERSIDIDTQYDFDIAEILLSRTGSLN
ncbi:acylneuraminate cytidylyltransferase family protein [Gammaproteobacteria bacterium]|nr:acylneuraminate cytidylyltransferase family protein [Gammaproteobacteria bacterium]